MTADNLVRFDLDEEDQKIGIGSLSLDLDIGRLTVPVKVRDNFRLECMYSWNCNQTFIGNIKALKSRVVILLKSEFEELQKITTIIEGVARILKKNESRILELVPKIITPSFGQNFEFIFDIPEELAKLGFEVIWAEDQLLIKIKDSVFLCKIKPKIQDILDDFDTKSSNLDLELGSQIKASLSRNLELLQEAREEWDKKDSEKAMTSAGTRKLEGKTVKVPIFKYSARGRIAMHESILYKGIPYFIKYENNEIKLVEDIKENNTVWIPPTPDQYYYQPYEFQDQVELDKFSKEVDTLKIEDLYKEGKEIVRKFNDIPDHMTVLMAADVVWTYWQDRFATTHYLGVTGDNGAGKSAFGISFEVLGYRVVNLTDPSAANLFRALGSYEIGQCTLVCDEAEKIGETKEILSVLKTGYQKLGKVAKTYLGDNRQYIYWTFCYKIIIAEKSPDPRKCKGVLDRTFIYSATVGKPKYDIKEVLEPAGNKTRLKLLGEILDFRKKMLLYRVKNHRSPIQDIDVGFNGRNKELVKPTIQLFIGTSVQNEIEKALQKFLDEKNKLKSNTVEAMLATQIERLIDIHENEPQKQSKMDGFDSFSKPKKSKSVWLKGSEIWEYIKANVLGNPVQGKPNQYDTDDYGMVHRNTISKALKDRFGAEISHEEKGNSLIFDKKKFRKIAASYQQKQKIRTRVLAEGTEGTEGNIG